MVRTELFLALLLPIIASGHMSVVCMSEGFPDCKDSHMYFGTYHPTPSAGTVLPNTGVTFESPNGEMQTDKFSVFKHISPVDGSAVKVNDLAGRMQKSIRQEWGLPADVPINCYGRKSATPIAMHFMGFQEVQTFATQIVAPSQNVDNCGTGNEVEDEGQGGPLQTWYRTTIRNATSGTYKVFKSDVGGQESLWWEGLYEDFKSNGGEENLATVKASTEHLGSPCTMMFTKLFAFDVSVRLCGASTTTMTMATTATTTTSTMTVGTTTVVTTPTLTTTVTIAPMTTSTVVSSTTAQGTMISTTTTSPTTTTTTTRAPTTTGTSMSSTIVDVTTTIVDVTTTSGASKCRALTTEATDQWCTNNCNHVTPFCPARLCQCGSMTTTADTRTTSFHDTTTASPDTTGPTPDTTWTTTASPDTTGPTTTASPDTTTESPDTTAAPDTTSTFVPSTTVQGSTTAGVHECLALTDQATDQWCTENCNHVTPYCPLQLCRCNADSSRRLRGR